MSLTECARLVERGDPDRFRATMAAPPALRARLWPLHAANLEIARAPWASGEPLVAEMRLQWWIDTIGGIGRGGRRPGHPVAEALAPLLAEDPALAPLLVAAAEARRRDCWREPFPDAAALEAYLAATAGNPAWAAARALGAPPASEAAIRDFAWAAGLAAYLRAAAELAARGRVPFPDPRPAALAALAGEGLARIARARSARRTVPRHARPALWHGAAAPALLALAARDPARILEGRLTLSPMRHSAALAWRALTGSF